MTGVGFYVDQLARHLNQIPDQVQTTVLTPPLDRLATRAAEGSRKLATRGGLTGRSLLAPVVRRAWETARSRYFRWYCARHHVDVYHEPNYIPLPYHGPTVTTIHDLSVLLHPHWHPQHRVQYFEKHFRGRLGLSTRFIADSDFTRREMLQHLSLPADRVHVVPLAARDRFQPLPPARVQPVLDRLKLPARYLLFVGTLEPRKNLAGLVRAYAGLPNRFRKQNPLVLVGRQGWCGGELDSLIQHHKGDIHCKGYVAEHDLAAVYNGATAMVYPSFYEGFGLPPLEMMACGRPVITSNSSSLPEVVGQAALTVNPHDDGDIRSAIVSIIANPELAKELGELGRRRALEFSWANTARLTLEVYRQAVSDCRSQSAA